MEPAGAGTVTVGVRLSPLRSMEMALHDEKLGELWLDCAGRTTTVTGSFIDLVQGDGFVKHWSEMSRSTRSPGTCSPAPAGIQSRAGPHPPCAKSAQGGPRSLVIWLDPERTIPICDEAIAGTAGCWLDRNATIWITVRTCFSRAPHILRSARLHPLCAEPSTPTSRC